MQTTHLSHDEFTTLVEYSSGPDVSIYMPTHRTGPETRQDPIRFKNLLNSAAKQLRELGVDDGESILAPAKSIPEDVTAPFWRSGADGLALFLSNDVSRCFKLPIEVPELTVVADQFHIKPLLRYVQDDGHFYVLAASQNQVSLFAGTKHQLAELEVDALPTSLRDALRIDEYQPTLQWHTSNYAAPVASGGEATFHGHGAGDDGKKKDLLRYFQRLDKAIVGFLGDQSAPLVFAGVDYLFPIYQEANHFRGLVETPVAGNPDRCDADDLHGPSWEVVAPRFSAARADVLENYGLAESQGAASANLKEILPAARQGRVDKLLVAEGERRWGKLDRATGAAEYCEENTAEACDLVDYAAAETLRNSGRVYLFEDDESPDFGAVAAVYRY